MSQILCVILRESEQQLDAVRRVDTQAARSGKLDLMKELGEAKKQLAEIEAKYGSGMDVAGLRKQLDVKDGELRSANVRESQLNQVSDNAFYHWIRTMTTGILHLAT